MSKKPQHWADKYADKIVREKGEKDEYVCASGITPSGTVHIGNFREIISVDLVYRALKDMGKKSRFIYSWDDYDVFRKVPKNMPNPKKLETYLRMPITDVPDTRGTEDNYAGYNEKELERLLHKVGVDPDYIYQEKRYRQSVYAKGLKKALDNKETIRNILNQHRSEPLPESWLPVSVFCTQCKKDTTRPLSWDGKHCLNYECDSCGNNETMDLRETGAAKLPWRVDWPMRWQYEDVDFEPAGKDHHSEGGSFDTAREIVQQVYGGEPPVTFQYDFVRIKGRGGKISSSSGEVVSLSDVLEIYQPEVVRYLFASTRPNSEFAVSFDLDVLKIYEDYDKCERVYFGEDEVGEKKKAKQSRIYEFSQVEAPPEHMPFQMPFRHLCNMLQIHDGDIEGVIARFPDLTEAQKNKLRERAVCAWNWITSFAPEDFRFSLKQNPADTIEVSEKQKKALTLLYTEVSEKLNDHDEKSLAGAMYSIAEEAGLDIKEFFAIVYTALIDKEKGPRLANFIMTAGSERIAEILKPYAQ